MFRHLLLERWRRQRSLSRILVRRHSLLRRPLFGARLRSGVAVPVDDDELVARASPVADLVEPVAEGPPWQDAALAESNQDMPGVDALLTLAAAPSLDLPVVGGVTDHGSHRERRSAVVMVRNHARTVAASKFARRPSFHAPLLQPAHGESAVASSQADGSGATRRDSQPSNGVSAGAVVRPVANEEAAERDQETRYPAAGVEAPAVAVGEGAVAAADPAIPLGTAPIAESNEYDRSPRAWATRLAELERQGSADAGAVTDSTRSMSVSEPGRPAMRQEELPVVADRDSPPTPAAAAALGRPREAARRSRPEAPAAGAAKAANTKTKSPHSREMAARDGVEERERASGFEKPSPTASTPPSPRGAVRPPATERGSLSGPVATRPLSRAVTPGVAPAEASAAGSRPALPGPRDLRSPSVVKRLQDQRDPGLDRRHDGHGPVTDERAEGQIRATTDSSGAGSLPVGMEARQSLRALVGIDPAPIRLHRRPWAQRIVERRQADAIALGPDDVAIGAASREDTPEGLGLLAHELVHVARRRQPTFVPAIIAGHADAMGPGAAPLVRPVDEENIARAVERRVTATARELVDRTGRVALPSAATSGPVGSRDPLSAALTALPSGPELGGPIPPSRSRWGSLPAPWEPLPEMIRAPSIVPATKPARSEVSIGSGLAPVAEGHAAARERRVASPTSTNAPQAPAAQSPTDAEQPDPDLDALARQVYGVLKRRLAAEKRRMG
jgi:Domain of unknown function (DUF4157)